MIVFLKKYLLYFVGVFLICSISPIFVSVVFFLFLYNQKIKDDLEGNLRVIGALLCFTITVSAINCVKVPENDLEAYVNSYIACSNISFIDYLYIGSNAMTSIAYSTEYIKEPVFAALVWVFNRIFLGNVTAYLFALTTLNYFLLGGSVYLLGKAIKIDLRLILVGMFLMCFIPYIFTMSIQLNRQFLASSLLIYILTLRCSEGENIRKTVLLIIIACLIHTTFLLFVPFIIMPAYDKSFKERRIWYIGAFCVLFSIQFLASGLLESVGSNSSMTYALSRASSDTTKELGQMSDIVLLMNISIGIIYVYLGHVNSFMRSHKGITRMSNIVLFLVLFIFLNLHQEELSGRFTFYLYNFIPIGYMMLAKEFNILKKISFSICLVVFIGFCLYVYQGAWTYELPFNFIASPLFAFFL